MRAAAHVHVPCDHLGGSGTHPRNTDSSVEGNISLPLILQVFIRKTEKDLAFFLFFLIWTNLKGGGHKVTDLHVYPLISIPEELRALLQHCLFCPTTRPHTFTTPSQHPDTHTLPLHPPNIYSSTSIAASTTPPTPSQHPLICIAVPTSPQHLHSSFHCTPTPPQHSTLIISIYTPPQQPYTITEPFTPPQ